MADIIFEDKEGHQEVIANGTETRYWPGVHKVTVRCRFCKAKRVFYKVEQPQQAGGKDE